MNLNVVRPVKVTGVSRTAMGTFLVDTDCLLGGSVARWEARTVISGKWGGPETAVILPLRCPRVKLFFSLFLLGSGCRGVGTSETWKNSCFILSLAGSVFCLS